MRAFKHYSAVFACFRSIMKGFPEILFQLRTEALMRFLVLAALTASAAVLAIAFPSRAAHAQEGPVITGPFSHDNLSIYFVHGKSAPGPAPLTLQEALAKESVRVAETGSVNELKIENLGDEDVYIQSGDIVKGGRQDRVLTASFILPKKSGAVPIASYCVEHGRWSKRGGEDASKFASSANAIPSREAKLAMKAPAAKPAEPVEGVYRPAGRVSETSERQRAVWDEVSRTQEKLSAGIRTAVAAPASSTSLELSLENDKLKDARADAIKALENKTDADDIVGFAFAVNGRINSADVYPSNALFRKMWTKLLTAAVTEAVGEKSANTSAEPAPSLDSVRAFFADAEKGASHAEEIGVLAKQNVRDADKALFVEASRADGQWVHRNYLAK
jgi:hypothetical protein